MPLGVSIVIGCHNSAERLPTTLAHLSRQKVRPEIPWEIIVVDNASTDDTAVVARSCWPNHPTVPLRVVHEANLGSGPARTRGCHEARYEYMCVVDDDNWVCEDWVELVADIMTGHPQVGVCGSYSEAAHEGTLPWWFEAHKDAYAVGSWGSEQGDVTDKKAFMWSAGLTIRKSAWDQLHRNHFQSQLIGKKGQKVGGGDDSEICLALRSMGWRWWYEPRLRFQHFLPAKRLTWSYLRSVCRGYGASEVILDAYQHAHSGKLANRKGRFIRNEWLRQLIIEVKAILHYRTKLLRAPWQSLEGDPDVLEIDRLAGKICELLRTRGTYLQHRRTVEHLTAPGTS